MSVFVLLAKAPLPSHPEKVYHWRATRARKVTIQYLSMVALQARSFVTSFFYFWSTEEISGCYCFVKQISSSVRTGIWSFKTGQKTSKWLRVRSVVIPLLFCASWVPPVSWFRSGNRSGWLRSTSCFQWQCIVLVLSEFSEENVLCIACTGISEKHHCDVKAAGQSTARAMLVNCNTHALYTALLALTSDGRYVDVKVCGAHMIKNNSFEIICQIISWTLRKGPLKTTRFDEK